MTTVADAEQVIPGLYDIPAELYHSDPIPGGSLSSTGARRLTDCPARFKYFLDNPEPYKPEFEFGTAAHTRILGNGPELVVVDAKRWDTNEIKQRVASIRSAGKIPLKPDALQRIDDMAEVLASHPEASDLLTPGSGLAEQSIFWEEHGIWRRSRIDWLRPHEIVDYKSARSVHPDYLQKAVAEYGYHQQHDFYFRGALHLGLIPASGTFKFIFQEKTPPYLAAVVELDFPARVIGGELNDRAFHAYAMGRETGHWPAYSEGLTYLSLPPWVERKYAEENL
ncbi:PD-(D/E)XK nuclease-like domain-containing protein [Streptomyces sp. NPDC051597]|uniref:PD-(D/E)XK nuclease-like domain-containing protein n=1 Tax=Streptomyces sp. NPDC051597 TaxID=3155049 RepID=UPI00342B5BA8